MREKQTCIAMLVSVLGGSPDDVTTPPTATMASPQEEAWPMESRPALSMVYRSGSERNVCVSVCVCVCECV